MADVAFGIRAAPSSSQKCLEFVIRNHEGPTNDASACGHRCGRGDFQ